jgi:hypothetical protein
MSHLSIASKIASIAEVEKQKNRRNLKLIIDATMFLAKQGMAFRGHFEQPQQKCR